MNNQTVNNTFPNSTIATVQTMMTKAPKQIGLDVAVYVFYAFIFVTGMVGNVLVVLTITRSDKSKSLKHCFLLNLAITDLLTLILVLPLSIMGKHVSWPFGLFVCKYIYPLTDVVIAVSVLTHVSISLDRYRTIIYPMSAKPSHFQRIAILITIWILSYLLNGLPLSLVFKVGHGFWVKEACVLEWPSIHVRQVYYLQRFIVIFAIPILVNLVSYVRISKALKVSLLLLQGSARGQKRDTRIRSQQRLIRMFCAIFVAFITCFLPIHLVTMLMVYCKPFNKWSGSGHLFQVAIVFAYANSMCNPVILVIMSTDYRKTFLKYIPILKCQRYRFLSSENQARFFRGDDGMPSPVTTQIKLLPTSKQLQLSNMHGRCTSDIHDTEL